MSDEQVVHSLDDQERVAANDETSIGALVKRAVS